MTMKSKKTLQHIAAVAVVLLTLCLVFAAPVSAVGVDCSGDCAEPTHVAAIGNEHYTTLAGAIADAAVASSYGGAQVEVDLLVDVDGVEAAGMSIPSGSNILIDFNNHIYNGTAPLAGSEGTKSQVFQLLKDSTITMQDGTIKSQDAAMLIMNYADLTLQNMVLDGRELAVGYVAGSNKENVQLSLVLSNNNGNVVIDSTTIYEATGEGHTAGTAAFDVDYWGTETYPTLHVTVQGTSNIVGDVIADKVDVDDAGKYSFTINGGTFTDPTVLNYLGDEATTETVTVRLAEDVAISNYINVQKGEATLDLAGNILSREGEGKNVVIYLNGATLNIESSSKDGEIANLGTPTDKEPYNHAIWVAKGALTVKNNVNLVSKSTSAENSVVYIVGSTGATNICSSVTIENGATIKRSGDHSITVGEISQGVSVSVSGNLEGDITINGQARATKNAPVITLAETAQIEGGVYAAGYGIWTIGNAENGKGPSLTGNEALSIKSGKFTINGGTFTATGANTVPPTGNDNGSEDTGAALSITSNDDYAGNIEVTVNGGTFKSTNGHAVYEGIAKNKDGAAEATESKVKSISITAGSFESGKDTDTNEILDVIRIDAATNKKVVSGGIFNKAVKEEYIVDGKYSVANLDSETKATHPYGVAVQTAGFPETSVGFDSVKVGYSAVEAKEVTITNTGNSAVVLQATEHANYEITLPTDATVAADSGECKISIKPKTGLPVGNYADTIKVKTNVEGLTADIEVSFLVYQPSSGGSSTTKPEEPVEPETPVEPENPTEEPEAGEATVETEVTDGGEVLFEAPVEPETPGADTPSDEPAEPTVTGVELPAGTDSEVAFIPVSEKPAPAGKETQTKKVFEINVPKYEKGKPATVKFTMTVAELAADGKTAADVALWHQDEETGEWTKLVTTFVIIDGVVYFEAITFDFSPFAIVYEDVSAPTEPETPEQPTESPAPILAVLAGLGAAAVLRRK